ncbi:hypothetical protein [Deefgea piscis]|uniref:hypothetical protein n=1 Tax=Deefgea piscis TaxID=2739061 RepID=UPI001C803423|nr:hypothetical protein [Deefgea piscis]QZA81612.1 hypothetical protein K4H25_02815 [Deefgea piscis]
MQQILKGQRLDAYLTAQSKIVVRQGQVELQCIVYLGEQSWRQKILLTEGEYELQQSGWVSLSGEAEVLFIDVPSCSIRCWLKQVFTHLRIKTSYVAERNMN